MKKSHNERFAELLTKYPVSLPPDAEPRTLFRFRAALNQDCVGWWKSCVVKHLVMTDPRFQGNSWLARRNRDKARKHAERLFLAYEKGRYEAVGGVITGWVMSFVMGVILQLTMGWVERLVEELITEWLNDRLTITDWLNADITIGLDVKGVVTAWASDYGKAE